MKYEISNLVSNHKYTEWEIRYRNPFKDFGKGVKRQKRTCYLLDDDPKTMLEAYKLGLSMKPHAFKIDPNIETRQCFVNCIILDFDNLTKEQFEFVKMVSRYGDYSSGMKTWVKENSGIPNAQPPKWKYKVFFRPIENVLCTYDDIDRAFKSAVRFYNPYHTQKEVEEVWTAWKRANNRKDRITDPIFNGWILPDVAMLSSFRTQITYGVNLEQKDKFKELDDDDPIFRTKVNCSYPTKFPVTDKNSYSGLDWKLEEISRKPPKLNDPQKKELEALVKGLEKDFANNCHIPYSQYSLPTTKAAFAQTIGKNHIEDLVLPVEGIRHVNSAWWGQIKGHQMNTRLDMDELMKDADIVAKTFARIYCEMRVQGYKVSFRAQSIEDICSAMKFLHGPNLFSILDKHRKETLLHKLASSYGYAWLGYRRWRAWQKLKKTVVNHRVLELRDKWRQSKSHDDMTAYFVELNQDIQARMKAGEETKCPYDYHRRGFKGEIMEQLLNGEVRLDTPTEFIERLRKFDITPSKDGEFTDELLTSWFYQYRAEWNRTHEGDQIGRKSRSSKYDDIFNSMTKEEALAWIESSDLHRQQKKRLKERLESRHESVTNKSSFSI